MFKSYITILYRCECLYIWNFIFMMFVFMGVINATIKALSSMPSVEATFLSSFSFSEFNVILRSPISHFLSLTHQTCCELDEGCPQSVSWVCLWISFLPIHKVPAYTPVGFPSGSRRIWQVLQLRAPQARAGELRWCNVRGLVQSS